MTENIDYLPPDDIDPSTLKLCTTLYEKSLQNGSIELVGIERIDELLKVVEVSGSWLAIRLMAEGIGDPQMTQMMRMLHAEHSTNTRNPWEAAKNLLQECIDGEHVKKYNFEAIRETLKLVKDMGKEQKEKIIQACKDKD